MRSKPPNTLNHNQHDFLVALAEDVGWRDAARDVGWDPEGNTVRGQMYLLIPLLHMTSVEDFEMNIEALRREAKLRGYRDAIYYGMYDEEPPEQTIAELGEIPPRFVPILTPKEGG